jgi:hypothetical protein
MEARIQPSDELRCPHCGRWHPLIQKHREGTPYTQQMLFFECRRRWYYGGQIGTSSRFPTRRPQHAA